MRFYVASCSNDKSLGFQIAQYNEMFPIFRRKLNTFIFRVNEFDTVLIQSYMLNIHILTIMLENMNLKLIYNC
jgi:hypothetical protein